MKLLVLITAALVASGMAFGDPLVKGEVTDVEGAVIGGAMVMIHWDSERRLTATPAMVIGQNFLSLYLRQIWGPF